MKTTKVSIVKHLPSVFSERTRKALLKLTAEDLEILAREIESFKEVVQDRCFDRMMGAERLE